VPLDIDDETKMIKIKIRKDFSDEEIFFKVRLRSVLEAHVAMAEAESGIGGLMIKLDDLTQVENGTELFSKYVDMPVKNLQIGQGYALSNILSQEKFEAKNFESSKASVFLSKDVNSPSLKCGYNPEVLSYYVEETDPSYPLKINMLTQQIAQIKPYSTKFAEPVYLDLRSGFNQNIVNLYVKKANVYNSELSDMDMYFTTSELFGVCGNSPLKSFFEKLLYFLVVPFALVVSVYGVWYVGKRKLGDMGELKFDREAEI
jgi:hypothetical protein